MKIAIYGLFDLAGVCLYVGQTSNPLSRERHWRSSPRMRGAGFKFVILKRALPSVALEAESKMIQHYAKRGQAKLNTLFNRSLLIGKTVSLRFEMDSDVHALLKAKAAKLKVRFRDYLASILSKASK